MWTFVLQIFYAIIVSLVVSYLTRTKPQNAEAQNPEGVPTIADDQIVPVLFGTREMTQNNVLWWGDTRTEAIVKRGGKK